MNPLRDPRWPGFLQQHPRASVFHSPGWLEALRRAYGYEAAALTTSAPDQELANGIVYCRVNSRLTGCRLVSLPFSDHCEPLVDSRQDLAEMLGALAERSAKEKARYVEIRPHTPWLDAPPGFAAAKEYAFHTLDLAPSLDEMFRRFHRDCIQRKIRRAEREGLTAEEGRSESLLKEFYHLLVLTRRRLGMPPHPFEWFRSLADTLAENVEVHVARKDSQPVAGILTLRYKDVLVYKYGCSDARQNRLGGVPMLFWRVIRRAKEGGIREVDFGRSDPGDLGLIAFKDRWGCARSRLRYWRSPAVHAADSRTGWRERVGRPALACVPAPLLPMIGKLVTRHLG